MKLLAVVILIFLVWYLQGLIFRKNALKDVEYTCSFSKNEVMEGESIELVETLSNRKFLPIPWIKAELTTSKWLEFAQRKSVITGETRYVPSIFMLKSFQKIVRRWRVDCVKRGEFRLNRVDLVTNDLFGGSRIDSTVHISETVTVLPRPADLESAFISNRHLTGDTVTKRRLVEDPFLISGVREYTDRDSMNKIHWGLTARQGQIMVRNNDYTTSQTLAVLLNVQSMASEHGKVVNAAVVEEGIRVCAGLLEQAGAQGIPMRFGTNTSVTGKRETILTQEGTSGEYTMELMRLLSRLPLESTEEIGTFLEGVEGSLNSSDIALVTAFLNEDILNFYNRMSSLQVNVVLYVIGYVDQKEELEGYQILSTGFSPQAGDKEVAE